MLPIKSLTIDRFTLILKANRMKLVLLKTERRSVRDVYVCQTETAPCGVLLRSTNDDFRQECTGSDKIQVHIILYVIIIYLVFWRMTNRSDYIKTTFGNFSLYNIY